ncbi:hypothetical protein [Desulforhopalus sp. IMCC35007]|uniref:hypothetical protein n=1 Tax=Desulforhopalus sp. IMCC35007 TaxID=2569543 RepID=UPI0010AE6036|nr:hypothetical protein [Desulforhopalus sp. IMCC35007]TKB11267.1 hypothetical protein FCL48_04460 [Desulforhopalus sp. IMCC35007]
MEIDRLGYFHIAPLFVVVFGKNALDEVYTMIIRKGWQRVLTGSGTIKDPKCSITRYFSETISDLQKSNFAPFWE